MTKEDIGAQVDVWITELTEEELSKGTKENYKQIVKRFVEWLPDEIELDKALIIEFKEHLETQLGATSTKNHNITVLNTFLKWLGKQDCCVKTYKVQKKVYNNEVITMADYDRLLRWAKKLGDMQTYYIMEVLGATGIRVAELKYFTVENLDFTITVRNKGKERKIYVPQELKRELEHYIEQLGIKSGYIFRSPVDPNKMVNKVTIWRHMKKIAGRAKVNKKHVHAHSFRHLFAQRFMQVNGNIAILADVMGHSSVETTRHYAHESDTSNRHMIEELNMTKRAKKVTKNMNDEKTSENSDS